MITLQNLAWQKLLLRTGIPGGLGTDSRDRTVGLIAQLHGDS